MTLQYMEGFETCVDRSDLLNRGWAAGTSSTLSGTSTLTVPSRTAVSGRGLMLKGPYSAATGLPLQTPASVSDFGAFDTGKSIYSLWQSGGFSVGVSASFNKASTVLQIAPGDAQQLVYDGTQYYWAIGYNGANYAVMYSTDLINWTATTGQPTTVGVNSTICLSGTGSSATILVGTKSGTSAITPQYSTNFGATWSNLSIGASTNMKNVSATGSSTAPYVGVGWTSSAYFRVYTYASLGATPAVLSAPALTGSGTYSAAWSRLSSGMIIACGMILPAASTTPVSGASSGLAYCLASADPTNSANWTLVPSLSNYLNDAVWFNNRIVAVGYGGIWWSGAANSNSWSQPVATGSSSVWAIATNGTLLVAVGQDPTNATWGAIWTSADGVTWTKTNRFLFSNAGSNNANMLANVTWDGAQFVLTGCLNNNVIASSKDGLAWTALYYPDYAEAINTNSGSPLGIFGGAISGGVLAPYSTSSSSVVGLGFAVAAASGGARSVTPLNISGTGVLSNAGATAGSVSTSNLTHYYEIIATAAGTANTFTFQWALDGIIQGPVLSGSTALALTSDTTGAAHLIVNLPRNGNFTVIDDIYITSFAADAVSGNVGQLGAINIVGGVPTSDVQHQFTLNGTAASDSAQVAGALSNSEGSVYTSTQGAKDIYALSVTIPASYKVQAVQAEGYFSKYGPLGAAVTLGMVSGASEVDSPQVAATSSTPLFVTELQTADPSTSAQWTASGVQAAKIAITKAT